MSWIISLGMSQDVLDKMYWSVSGHTGLALFVCLVGQELFFFPELYYGIMYHRQQENH